MARHDKGKIVKLTRPRLHDAVLRARLFEMLDSVRSRRSAILLIGPPGAGKTSLVSSWMDEKGATGIWYQVDGGDADPATFFHYMREAARPLFSKGQRPLPSLTPEYLHDVRGFSRRFFRDLFDRLPPQSILVFDNYQEVDAASAFHRLVTDAVNEIPADLTLIVISRRDPPECYARLVANERVSRIDWQVLKLTLPETASILRRRFELNDAQVAHLHSLCGGWAAGLTLLSERMERGYQIGSQDTHSSLEGVFQYFASELFGVMSTEDQRTLLHVTHVPHVTGEQAVLLTGTATSAELLETQFQRQLFVQRRAGQAGSYEFHALFQAFLLHQAGKRMSANERSEIWLRAARIMERDGENEEAFALYLRAGDVSSSQVLALREAPALIAQGRWQVVVRWFDLLPATIMQGSPWMLHWRGVARSNIEPLVARGDLEAAYARAFAVGDRLCQARSCAAVIHTYELEYARFRDMDPWIERLQGFVDDDWDFHDADTEVRMLAGLIAGMLHRKPDDRKLDEYAERILSLLHGIADINLKIIAATYLLTWGSLSGPMDMALRARTILERLLVDRDITAINACRCWFLIGWNHHVLQEPDQCFRALETGMQIADRGGLSDSVRILGLVIGTWAKIECFQLDDAKHWLARLDALVDPTNIYDVASSEGIKAWLAVLEGQPHAALEHTDKALSFFDMGGCIYHQGAFRMSGVWGRIILRDYKDASAWVRDSREYIRRIRSHWHEIVLRMSEAWIALHQGDRDRATERLRAAFGLTRERGCEYAHGPYLRPWMPLLCEAALEAGIETDYVRKLIRRFRWPAPQSHPEAWAWAVRIYTLGAFRIEAAGESLVFSRKTPKKPLALLKAIIAMGGAQVAVTKLTDALWPEEEGDTAYRTFGLNLHRLRKLLGSQDSIELSDGKVSLNETTIWTDVRCFERNLVRANADPGSKDVDLALYRGAFLADAEDASWAVGMRERLQSSYIRRLCSQAQSLERNHQLDEAMELYALGIDRVPLAEGLYQGAIRCLITSGKAAEANSLYRRLSDALFQAFLRARSASHFNPRALRDVKSKVRVDRDRRGRRGTRIDRAPAQFRDRHIHGWLGS